MKIHFIIITEISSSQKSHDFTSLASLHLGCGQFRTAKSSDIGSKDNMRNLVFESLYDRIPDGIMELTRCEGGTQKKGLNNNQPT